MGEKLSAERAVVLGVNGVVGRALACKLFESGVSVVGLDLQESAFREDLGIVYEQCDAMAPTVAGLREMGSADTVVICLPEDAAIAALPMVVRTAAGGALIVDTLSVKGRILAALESLGPVQEWISINPMFSPSLGFSGQNIAIVEVNPGPRGAKFESLLASWGASTVRVGADEHDKITALMQVATHAAILAVGLVLHDWGYDVTKGIRMATPPHRICLALLARMSNASPEVYWDIQRSNMHGADARRCLREKLECLSEVVAAGEEERFGELMAKIGCVVEPLEGELLRCADSVSVASSI